jgi:hypothetical protein
VNAQTGALSLSAPLDADAINNNNNKDGNGTTKNNKLAFTIRAIDHGVPPRQTQMQINLNLIDINDNSPQFGQPEYSIEVGR